EDFAAFPEAWIHQCLFPTTGAGKPLFANTVASGLPDPPRRVAFAVHPVECDLVLECIHGRPESRMLVRIKLLLLDEALERLFNQFLPRLDEVEYVVPEAKKSTVHPKTRIPHRSDVIHDSVVASSHGVKGLPRLDRKKAGNSVFLLACFRVFRQ